MAWASKVLPVPVSPRMRIGTSDSAARAASFKQRCMASLPVQRSCTFRLERGLAMITVEFSMPRQLTKLPQRLECVFDERAAAYHEAGLAFHADPQRAFLIACV